MKKQTIIDSVLNEWIEKGRITKLVFENAILRAFPGWAKHGGDCRRGMRAASYLPKPATYWFAHDCNTKNMEFCRIMDFTGVMDVNGVKTILVVDSALAVQQFQRDMIESHGYKTKGVTDFAKGYTMLVDYQRQIDLVVIDHQSPQDPINDLIEKIRTNSDLGMMPVILLLSESDDFAGKANDRLRVIRKPYRPDFLLSEINRLTRSEAI